MILLVMSASTTLFAGLPDDTLAVDSPKIDTLPKMEEQQEIDWEYIGEVLDQPVGTYSFTPFRRPVYSASGQYIKDDLYMIVGNTATGESKIFFFNATKEVVEWQVSPFQLPAKPFEAK